MSTEANTKTPRSRAEVRRRYGHPWPWLSPEILREQMEGNGLDAAECARRFACNPDTVRKYANEYEIELGGDR